ncbi:MAG: arginine repressor [Acutalibacteraceae bacterium]|nr:hypothetical protein [Oscillospiraceae bacterium]
MKKNIRHEKILSLISEYDISTQEQLTQKLTECGFEVTQATVSRDIKAMNLIKIQDSNGQYKYAAVKSDKSDKTQYDAIISHSVVGVDYAMNITVLHCRSGMANAACASIDALEFNKSVGTIAGDDTIFILNRTEEAAKELADTIRSIIK